MRTKLACGAICMLALLPTTALAHDGDHADHSSSAGDDKSGVVTTDETDAPKTPEKYRFGVDWVMGFGKVNAVEQQLPGSTQILPTNVIVSAPFRTQTYLFNVHVALQSLGIGLRLPLSIGNIRDAYPGVSGDNTFTTGGLGIAFDMPKKLSDTLTLTPELEIVAPLAQGDTTTSQDQLSKPTFDKYASYKYSTNIAAAMARGYEDDALFWPRRVGIVPKATVALHTPGGVTFDPYLKLPIMIDAHTDSDERVRVEVVGGARLAYGITKWLEPGVRVWAMIPIVAQSGMRDPVAVVEPQLRFHSANTFALTIGGVLPFAGALTDPYVGGIRASIFTSF